MPKKQRPERIKPEGPRRESKVGDERRGKDYAGRPAVFRVTKVERLPSGVVIVREGVWPE